MAQSNAGIQKLLDAEKKASALVSEARKRKVQKLKTAKKEAEVEINKCKEEKENQFKAYEHEIFSKKGNSEAQIQVLTNQKLKDQEYMLKNNQSRTMKTLLEQVFNIEIRLHENVRF
ncbi:unnamed protein product [Candidula unifasciata]|uniref:V-type proton ATPase subunit G n=1 Tax=Candidula unifasciata TaxID=100452 RepID=A0A8S4AAY9_9EUPU|nr:unnamed protein product [Candidula unifasciata]